MFANYIPTVRKFFIVVFILWSTFCLSSSSFAANYVYVKLGEELSLKIDDASGKDVSWVVSQDGAIIERIVEENFSYTFQKAGLYLVKVNETQKNGVVKSTLVTVSVQEKIPSFLPLEAKLQTIPPARDGVITLSGDSQEVVFGFLNSTGAIETYSLESNIFEDSDGDGETDNDIDNKDDASFLSGTYFKKTYENTGIPSRAVLTIRDKNGNTSEDSVTIMFAEEPLQKEEGLLSVIVSTIPEKNKENTVVVPGSGGVVLVYSGDSTGDILQYKIDENIEVDSDKDGDPANDFDNKGTASEKSGASYPIALEKGKEYQTFSVSIVGKEGVRTEKYVLQKSINESAKNMGGDPLLFASRSNISEGESVSFTVFNVSDSAKISWDFDGDGEFEIEDLSEDSFEYIYAKKGSYPVVISIKEEGKSPVIRTTTVKVFDKSISQFKTNNPSAYFLAQVDGNRVSFLSSRSHADENLADTNLSYSWDFGDELKGQGPNAVHVYEKPGTYTVSLVVEDSIERTGVYTENVIISEINTEFTDNQHGDIIGKENKEEEKQEDKEVQEQETLLDDPVYANDLIPVTTNPNPASNTGSDSSPEEGTEKRESLGINGFAWWIYLILFLLVAPLLYLLKKKIDNPEESISAIVKGIKGKFSTKKSIEELEKELESIPEAEEKGEIQEKNDIIEEKEEKGGLEVLDAQEGEEVQEVQNEENTPDWMREYNEESQESEEVGEATENGEEINNSDAVNAIENINPAEESISESEPEWMSEENTDPEPLEKSESFDTLDDPFEVSHPEWLEDVKRGTHSEEKEEVLPEWMSEPEPEPEILDIPENNIQENRRSVDVGEEILKQEHAEEQVQEVPNSEDLPEWISEPKTESEPEILNIPEIKQEEDISQESLAPKKKRKRRKKKKNTKNSVPESREPEEPVLIETPIIAATNASLPEEAEQNTNNIPQWLQ